MTIKDLIFKFIEKFPTEWGKLPSQIRDLMVESPTLFELEFLSFSPATVPTIAFNNVVIKYDYTVKVWTVVRIQLPIIPTPF